MATNLGDLSVTLQLDIRPYAEGIKTALNIGKQFEVQSKNLFGKGINVDTSKIDNELKKLQTTLQKLPAGFSSATTEAGKFDDKVKNISSNAPKANKSLLESVQQISIAGYGLAGIANIAGRAITELINEANKFQNAILGLQSVAKFKGIDTNVATESVKNLQIVRDGLISITDASTGLKNLLSAGFGLEQSIELLKRFGDAAAFNRQSSLEFGYAVASATEGIKNGNSILVDNAGVTKNLSVILQEAGYSAQDLVKVTSDLNVREALYNGLLKETNAQLGDAARLTDTFAGKQAQLTSKVNLLKVAIGEGLQKGIMNYIDAIGLVAPANKKGEDTFKDLGIAIREFTTFSVSPMIYVWKTLIGVFKDVPNLIRNIIDELDIGIPIIDEALDKLDRFLNKRKSAERGTGEDDNVDTRDRFDRFGNPIGPETPEVKVYAKEIEAEGGTRSSNRGRSGRGNTVSEQEELNRLKLLNEEIAKLKLALAANTNELGSYYEIQQEIVKLEERRRVLTGESLKDLKSEVALIDTERQAIDEIIDNINKKNELFDEIVKASRERIISSSEFQTAKILFSDIADLMNNVLGQAWEEVFGKADTLAEMFIQSLAQKFLDMALQFALTSILSSIFPGAGLLASFFGGGGASPAGLPAGGAGLGNSIPDFIQRAPSIRNFERNNSYTKEVPYVASLKTEPDGLWVLMERTGQKVTRRKS